MPLQAGSSKETISANIAQLVREGRSQSQAAAIAYREAGKGASDDIRSDLLWEYFSTKDFWEGDKAPAQDMVPEQWKGLVGGLLQFFAEEAKETEHQQPPPDVKPVAAGIIYLQGETWEMPRVLLVKRSLDEEHFAGYWSIPGGKIDEGETPQAAAVRESKEEIGFEPEGELEVLKVTKLPLGDEHVTFLCKSGDQFAPNLNDEHTEYQWSPLDTLPKPIHPGVKGALADLVERQQMVMDSLAELDRILAEDSDFKESDHPRKDNGEFGTGGGSRPINPKDETKGSPRAAEWAQKGQDAKLVSTYRPSGKEWSGGLQRDPDKMTDEQFRSLPVVYHGVQPGHRHEGFMFVTRSKTGAQYHGEVKAYRVLPGSKLFPDIETDMKHTGQQTLLDAKENNSSGIIHESDLVEDKDKVVAKDGFWYAMAADKALGPYETPGLARLAFDRAVWNTQYGVTFDKATVRSLDEDGRLHVAASHISKAAVNPYLGREIPGWEQMGLQADKIYQMFRDPHELAKGAKSFNNLPLLIDHVPVDANDWQQDLVIGSTGTDAKFDGTYLDNSLVIWAQPAIDAVDSDEQKELSSAYRYDPDMTPGTYQGMKYDGVMRNIRGNHVALVKKGRAGPDVVVGDSALKPKENNMKHPLSRTALRLSTALGAFIAPKLAADKVLDLYPIFEKVSRKNIMAKDGKTFRPDALKKIIELARDAADPLLAAEPKAAGGLGPDDIIMHLLQGQAPAVAAEPEAVDVVTSPDPNMNPDPAEPEGNAAKIMEFLKSKGMGDDDLSQVQAMLGAEPEPAPTATGDDDDPDKDKDKDKTTGDDMPKNAITAKAMDAAIKKSSEDTEKRVTERLTGMHQALTFVQPYVGVLPPTYDSAEAVHRAALKIMGVDGYDTIHADALRPIIESRPKPGAKPSGVVSVEKKIAADSASAAGFAEMFPGAANISTL